MQVAPMARMSGQPPHHYEIVSKDTEHILGFKEAGVVAAPAITSPLAVIVTN